MNKYYELVIFTAAMQDYADWVLDNLDTNKIISYRLYRQHAVRNGAVFIAMLVSTLCAIRSKTSRGNLNVKNKR